MWLHYIDLQVFYLLKPLYLKERPTVNAHLILTFRLSPRITPRRMEPITLFFFKATVKLSWNQAAGPKIALTSKRTSSHFEPLCSVICFLIISIKPVKKNPFQITFSVTPYKISWSLSVVFVSNSLTLDELSARSNFFLWKSKSNAKNLTFF